MAAASDFAPKVIDRVENKQIFVDGDAVYQMGNYLGGGNASTVFECHALSNPTSVSCSVPVWPRKGVILTF